MVAGEFAATRAAAALGSGASAGAAGVDVPKTDAGTVDAGLGVGEDAQAAADTSATTAASQTVRTQTHERVFTTGSGDIP